MPDHNGDPNRSTDSAPEGQRETTPLRRDPNRVKHDPQAPSSPATPPPEERTRPAFHAPPPTAQAAPPAQARSSPQPPPPPPPAFGSAPHSYPSGHPPTSRQFQVPQGTIATPTPGRISVLGWALRGLGLLGVSVVSGLIWLAITPGNGQQEQAQGPQTEHEFHQVSRIEGYQKCVDSSTGDIEVFFKEHGCEHLSRALYTTTLDDGQRVLTSVVAVRMPNAAQAKQLNSQVTTDDTGNIVDLVSEGKRKFPPDFPELDRDYGYASQQQGTLAVIGESAYFSAPDVDNDRLIAVTRDALKLAQQQDAG